MRIFPGGAFKRSRVGSLLSKQNCIRKERTTLFVPSRDGPRHNIDIDIDIDIDTFPKGPSHRDFSGGPSCIVFGFLPSRPNEEQTVGQLDIQFQP
jgi:hypothetical protein